MKLKAALDEVIKTPNFSTLDSGLRDETDHGARSVLHVLHFSTLDSGLRDETGRACVDVPHFDEFQYPRLGSTR